MLGAPLTIEERIRGEVRVERLLTNQARIIRIRTSDGTHHGIGWRLDRFLAACNPSMTRSLFKRWCRSGWVHIDGRPAKAADVVRRGQLIAVVAPLPALPTNDQFDTSPLQIVHRAAGWLVANKPPGQLAHQAGRVLSGTLLNRLQELLEEEGIDPQHACLVNRIDKDTAGLVLCAWEKDLAAALGAALAAKGAAASRGEHVNDDALCEKTYLAICHGVPTGAHWRDPIADDPASRIKRLVAADGQPSHTEFTVLERAPADAYALLRIRLHTGRQHQIRVHAAHHGHPLIGDWLYGEPCCDIAGQCLHAQRLRFLDPLSTQPITLSAPFPSAWATLWQTLKDGATLTPRPHNAIERSKMGLAPAPAEDSLTDGWRRPSFLSPADFARLQESGISD